MRTLGCVVLLLGLSSCGGSAVLYTDELFRTAAPEIVEAWQSLAPWHDAQVRMLPSGAGMSALESDLKQADSGLPTALLVGVALSTEDQHILEQAFPRHSFLFFSSSAGLRGLGVSRGEAWATVAQAAARPQAQATVLFPENATAAERSRFVEAWRAGLGGNLTEWTWPQVGPLRAPGMLFQWAGSEADAFVAGLDPRIVVHGDPGTVKGATVSGLTWQIRRTRLGDFLWQTALHPGKNSHFLPLESIPSNR